MYVDDCLTGAETDESALELKNELTTIMMAAGFNLTKWASNSQQVLDSTQTEQKESSSIVNLTTQAESTKALGVSWDLKSDCFRFVPPQEVTTSSVSPTKRTMLSHSARVFDPLGLITPFSVRVNLLFQELWRREGLVRDSEVEVHGFRDASPKAYGAAVYIRITNESGNITTQLVMSKSRVAPVKTVSLPRLELLAAVVNARLVTYVAETRSVNSNRIVYTDSMVALHWIRRNSPLWKPFVANHVAKIQWNSVNLNAGNTARLKTTQQIY
ncbi:hypothetical protein AC249_AIPGENE22973 [Exaiptasia diaphana]|nr:hypothetical protein AC249_AIPGENE22973 [Exaiptasia diaphana]